MNIGKLLAIYRFKHNVGLRELAKEIGVSHTTLSRLENGKAPDAHTMVKLFNWLFEDMPVE